MLPSGLFSGMVAETELHVGEHIKMRLNSTCSDWMDVADLVRSQDFRILNGLGEDAGEEFLAAEAEALGGHLKTELLENRAEAALVGWVRIRRSGKSLRQPRSQCAASQTAEEGSRSPLDAKTGNELPNYNGRGRKEI